RIFIGCVVGQTTSVVIALFSCTHSDLFLVLTMFCHIVFLAHSIVGVILCVTIKGSQRYSTAGWRAWPIVSYSFYSWQNKSRRFQIKYDVYVLLITQEF